MIVLVLVLDWLLALPAALLLILSAFFGLQMLAAPRPRAPQALPPAGDAGPRPTVAVLIPAHNEGPGLLPTLHSLQPQLRAGDRVLVVADNCQDDTAAVARAAGVEVVERQNAEQRGKGHALDFGWRHLRRGLGSCPEVLLIVDADCLVEPGALDLLARRVGELGRPVQGLYLMQGRPGDGIRQRVAVFAWRVKNHARASGMTALGWPCQLQGSGMAFPMAVFDQVSLASGHLVEDLQLGLALAAIGRGALLETRVRVTSQFPVDEQAQQAQRARWEHGHLSMILAALPAFLSGLARRPRLSTLATFLDLAVPPLALLLMMELATVLASGAWWVFSGRHGPVTLALAGLAVLMAALTQAWRAQGRDLISGRELASLAGYVLAKIPLYIRFFTARQTEWIRSKRDRE